MKLQQKYYLGLDVSPSSIGWAVTDPEYKILRTKGKDMWGVRMYPEANTAEDRRNYRASRRRLQREKSRIKTLRDLFVDEITKVDPGFFARLDDSRFHMEERRDDNKQPFALFADSGYTDKEYFTQYPTVFHLRNELIKSSEPHDVRLVYLAIANMFRHRGNFFNDYLDASDTAGTFEDTYKAMVAAAAAEEIVLPEDIDFAALGERLAESGVSRSQQAENVAAVLGLTKKDLGYKFVQLICGLSVPLKSIFGENVLSEENKALAVSFRVSDYDEAEEKIRSAIGDELYEVIDAAKNLHDKAVLMSLIKDYDYLSEARIALYEQHKEDLKQLKAVLHRYDQKAFNEMFRSMEEGSYSAYVGSVNSYKCGKIRRLNVKQKEETLYKNITTLLRKMPQDDPDVAGILKKVETEAFLPKQLTSANGVIPNQLHAKELKAILAQAEKYLPFLKVRNEYNLTVSEQILQLFSFQIPYYVGPLGQEYSGVEGYNVWAKRIAPGKIYPWNLEEKIDVKQAANDFIQRLVGHCTYLTDAQTLPKQSLLYQKFEVLNELNNLRIYGEKISVGTKQYIYEQLFERGKKVSLKELKSCLGERGYGIVDNEDISGIDLAQNGFIASLSSLGKFRAILGDKAYREKYQKAMEDIIFWCTVYGKNKKFLKGKIDEKYPGLFTSDEKKRILNLNFKDWGRLSRQFLKLEGVSYEDGVIRSIICAMWETNHNLMELLGGGFTYKESLERFAEKADKPLCEWEFEDIKDMSLSAPVERMVWQTLTILREIEKVMGCAPERIFVEVPRTKGKEKEQSALRKRKLLTLYKAIGKEADTWREEIEARDDGDFRSKKMYLYYMQKGKCMYTGERIELDELMKADSKWDTDHIYPRHFVKDDSLENNLVLVNKTFNNHKQDIYPLEPAIQENMVGIWKELLDGGFITREKYNRLTRKTELTAEEKASFINRQIVETGQGTRAITQILEQAFPSSEIVFSKADRVSDFRKDFDFPKVRCVNDFHYAQDAYLNIVVGNTYYVKFTKSPLNFIRESEKRPEQKENRYHLYRMFDWDVRRGTDVAWLSERDREEGTGTITTVRKMMAKNSPLVTRLCREVSGGITRKVTIWPAEKAAKGSGYIPIKMNDPRLQDVSKYGGLSDVQSSGYSLLEYKVKGKVVRSLEALPIYLGKVEHLSDERMLEYFESQLQAEYKGRPVEDLRICRRFIPQYSLIRSNGFYYYLGGRSLNSLLLYCAVQPCFSAEDMFYIKKLEKAVSQNYFDEKDKDKNPVLTKERNQALYQRLKEKYEHTIYRHKRGTIAKTIIGGEGLFKELSLKEQCAVLLELVSNLKTGDVADLSLIGGSKSTGKIVINKKISDAGDFILIAQSPTGLYQHEINLLRR